MPDFVSIFIAVFLAELGDKTQLAALLFSAESRLPAWAVFVAASAALVTATGLAVMVGSSGARFLGALPLKPIAGLGFVAIGVWLIVEHLRGLA
jgi:putative Ca2+/H+ antiporter (TMEM165/GDT1 family)